MKRRKRERAVPNLSAIEISVLEIVWRQNKASVREVHEQILKEKYVPYTTIASAMNNLTSKGILQQDKVGKAFYYSATIDRFNMAKGIVDMAVDKFLGGSSVPLVAHLLLDKMTKQERELVMKELFN